MEPDPKPDEQESAEPEAAAPSGAGAGQEPGRDLRRGRGEPYTRMPDFRRAPRRRWLYWVFAGALALASAAASRMSRHAGGPTPPSAPAAAAHR